MKRLTSITCALSLAAAALLSACGGSQPPIGAPGLVPQSHGAAASQNLAVQMRTHTTANSWMNQKTSSGDLLYVTDRVKNVVRVFSFPSLGKAGTLRGFSDPFGECIDGSGHIWIVNHGSPGTVV